jgi:hypothetical protein
MDFDEAATEAGTIVQHVAASIDMLGHLPRYGGDEARAAVGVVGVACLESFFVHVRALVDYFLPPPASQHRAGDRYVTELDGTWKYPDGELRRRLVALREITNQHIAHITVVRHTGEVEDTSTARLVAIVRDVLTVADYMHR